MKKNFSYTIIFILTFLLSIPSYSQKEKKEEKSTKTELNLSPNFDSTFNVGYTNLLKNQGTTTKDEAKQYYAIGNSFYKKNQIELALNNYLRGISILKKKNNYNQKDNWTFDIFIQTIKIYLQKKETKNARSLYNYSSGIFKNNKELQLLELEILESEKKWESLDVKINSLVNNQLSLKEQNSVLEKTIVSKVEQSKAVNSNLNNKFNASQKKKKIVTTSFKDEAIIEKLNIKSQEKIANTYGKKGYYEDEIRVRDKIINKKNISESIKAKQKINKAKALQKTKREDESYKILIESLALAEKSGNKQLEKEALLEIITYLETKNRFSESLPYYKKHLKVTEQLDSINLKLQDKQLKEKTLALQQEEVIKNIDTRSKLFSKEKELEAYETNLQQEQIKIQNWLISILGFIVLALIVGLFWYKKQRSTLRKNNQELELTNLRSQMNPHFIFNSLNAVNHFIAQKNELLANEYLTEFALLMRNTLNQSDLKLIPLQEEIEFLKRYCELEKMRFDAIFDYQFIVDKNINISAFTIPPLLLQPFIENSVWHGLRYLKSKGMLKVHFKQIEDTLYITIEDNGIGRKKSQELKTKNQQKQTSKGMSLIKRRIEISNNLTNTKIDWNIEDGEKNGTKVNIKIYNKK